MMRRRDLLAGAPAIALLPIASTATPAAEPLSGMPLAAHYGKLAGEALMDCEFSQHFDMQVRQGEVWFHNRHDPREAIAHHFRMIQKEAAKIQPPLEEDRWLYALAKVIYGVDL